MEVLSPRSPRRILVTFPIASYSYRVTGGGETGGDEICAHADHERAKPMAITGPPRTVFMKDLPGLQWQKRRSLKFLPSGVNRSR
jgi:hypothetical protein